MNDAGPLPLVTVEEVTKTFGEGRVAVRAVDNVSFDVGPGEFLLVMGPSGSGKTTLLSIIGGLMRPTVGRITIAGTEITSRSEHELVHVRRHLVGFIFQSFNLLEALSVQENVELVLDIAGTGGRQSRARASAVLRSLGLGDRLRFLPRTLSGGEKQRVSIARALANEPRVILADEPTANLDSRHGRDVMLLLKSIARQQDRAVIAVSHDERIRKVADRVLWLEDGRIREIGRFQKDPVCGMSVDEERAIRAAADDGSILYFCSNGCRDEFLASPERFDLGVT